MVTDIETVLCKTDLHHLVDLVSATLWVRMVGVRGWERAVSRQCGITKQQNFFKKSVVMLGHQSV